MIWPFLLNHACLGIPSHDAWQWTPSWQQYLLSSDVSRQFPDSQLVSGHGRLHQNILGVMGQYIETCHSGNVKNIEINLLHDSSCFVST